jgi:predicted  nucleic acid-binding Zn-ribbon protein
MKRFGWLMAIILVVALAACGQQTGTAPKAAVSTGKSLITGKQVTRISQNAAEMLQSYARQVREEYVKSAEAQLERVVRRVEQLQARFEKAGTDVQARASALLKSFNHKRDAARAQLEKLKAADEQPWEALKGSLDEALNDLEEELDRMLGLSG